MAGKDDTVPVEVGFNQQQRQLIDQLEEEGVFGTERPEVVREVFAQWLKEEGLA